MPMLTAGNWNRRSRGGFTVFELLVVLAVLAISYAFVVPYLGSEPGLETEETVRFVREAFNEGRTLAKLKRRNVLMEFEPSLIRVDGKEELHFPGTTRFLGLFLAGTVGTVPRGLLINHRGIVPSAIVRIEIDGEVGSLLISPVLNGVEWRSGEADFEDFAE